MTWTNEKNARRCFLIDKEIAGTLKSEELVELRQLTIEVDEYVQKVAPLPMQELRDLYSRLKEKSRKQK